MSERARLPHTDGGLYLADGGIETVLIHQQGIDLPAFAAFPLVHDERGRDALRDYFAPYLALAREHDAGFVLTSPTWRANADWGAHVGYADERLGDVNRRCIELMEEVRAAAGPSSRPVLIEGLLGPREDGYRAQSAMSPDEAERYHAVQLGVLADTAADFASAITLTYADEATGVVRAARKAGLPVAISFTLETDGRLPSGQALGDAIRQVDDATDGACAYFGINCAHPAHFADAIDDPAIRDRVRALRANASMLSHAELDAADELDDGDPADLAARYAGLRDDLPRLCVLGGCCGTDIRHVRAIAGAWAGT
jgi:homocysteine S-methyltransferase